MPAIPSTLAETASRLAGFRAGVKPNRRVRDAFHRPGGLQCNFGAIRCDRDQPVQAGPVIAISCCRSPMLTRIDPAWAAAAVSK